jgi:hypothetical protein
MTTVFCHSAAVQESLRVLIAVGEVSFVLQSWLCGGDEHRVVGHSILLSGLRASELLGFKWADIDFNKNELSAAEKSRISIELKTTEQGRLAPRSHSVVALHSAAVVSS